MIEGNAPKIMLLLYSFDCIAFEKPFTCKLGSKSDAIRLTVEIWVEPLCKVVDMYDCTYLWKYGQIH